MKEVNTYCALRLGDNLLGLHFVRWAAKLRPEWKFTHWLHSEYLAQCVPVVRDLSNIELRRLTSVHPSWWNAKPPVQAIDLWKNANGFWETNPFKNDYCRFALHWWDNVARKIGIHSGPALCCITREELLFDYPALVEREHDRAPNSRGDSRVLVVNSPAQSGQAPDVDPNALDDLIIDLAKRRPVFTTFAREKLSRQGIWCTQSNNYDITQIGQISLFCDIHVMVSTGPSWPTFNRWNDGRVQFRGLFLRNERIKGIDTNRTFHADNVSDMRVFLMEDGIL